MTRRAILWCGHVRPAGARYPLGRSMSDAAGFPDCDFPASVNDLELGFRSARELGISVKDIHPLVCDPDLLPSELSSRSLPATLESLENVLARIRRAALPEDALLFVATNHGCPEGLLTSTPVDELDELDGPVLLSPEHLGGALDSIPGAQVIIVAACHAGIFLPLGGPPDRTVLASCAADLVYRVHREERSCSPFLVELFASWCGVALWDDVVTARHPLGEAFTRAQARLAGEHRTAVPLVNGPCAWPS